MSRDEAIKRIKEEPISRIVGHFIPLTRKGANTFAVCPFHNDHNPSMSVHDGMGIFHCFTCGAKGDSIQFVRDFKSLEFIDALKVMAEIVGISPEELDKKEKGNPKRDLALKVLLAASKIYRKSAQGQQDFEDFLKKREIDAETAEKFQLGYAAKTPVLLPYLRSLPPDISAVAIELALEIGMLAKGKNGDLYEKFRDRIMFPIWDQSHHVVGFTSRSIHQDQVPKYLNSKGSFIFDKQNLLYGLNFAKSYLRSQDEAIIVEGQMDVIALSRHGLHNAIASSGTAFNEGLLKRITHFTKNIVLAMDSDQAGFTAMQKISQFCLSMGILPKFLNFLPHKDVDEFLKAEGGLKLREKMETAPLFLSVEIERLIPHPLPQLSHKKIEVLDRIFNVLAPLGDHLLAREKIAESAKLLGLHSDPEAIIHRYLQFIENKQTSVPLIAEEENLEILVEEKEESLPSPPKILLKMSQFERQMLSQIVEHPEILRHVKIGELLDFVEHNEVQMVVWKLQNLYDEIDETEYQSIVKAQLESMSLSKPVWDVIIQGLGRYDQGILDERAQLKLALDLEKGLKLENLKLKRAVLQKQGQDCDDEEKLAGIMADLITLQKEFNTIKQTKTTVH